MAHLIREAVFEIAFSPGPRGRLLDGPALPGKRHGPVPDSSGEIDLRQGGYVTFPHDCRFDLRQPLSVECWVRLDRLGQMPVLLSCGQWNVAGWFLQRLGNRWRWHVGGIDCDGGQPRAGRWIHLAATYDGETAKLYEDGKPVGERAGRANQRRWPGDLHVGQYSAQPGPSYQMTGQLKGVRIYHRALDVKELATKSQ
jgi:hypothetical protein